MDFAFDWTLLLSWPLALLLVCALFAGLVDGAIGGGGMIQLPGLFVVFPQLAPPILLGTNKLSSVFGTSVSFWKYARQVRLPWRTLMPVTAIAFVCALGGAALTAWVAKEALRPVVLVLLLGMLAYTFYRKDFGQHYRPREASRARWATGLSIGGAIGFHDGFFGPGTGSFLVFLFIRFFGFDFLHASAAARLVNLGTNLAALAFFLPHGSVLYAYALPMACANIAGSWLGAHLAIRGGSMRIRKLFLLVVSALIVQLAWTQLTWTLARTQ